MNKFSVFLFALILISPFASAGDIAELDNGTYVLLGRDRAPTDMFYRLSKIDDKWVWMVKNPAATGKILAAPKVAIIANPLTTKSKRISPPTGQQIRISRASRMLRRHFAGITQEMI